MKITEITENLSQLNLIWPELFVKSRLNNPFLSWQWCSTWWKYFGSGKQLMVLLAEDTTGPIGLAPLMVTKGDIATLGKPIIQFIGAELADYSDFLIVQDHREVLKLFWDYLRSSGNSGKIKLARLTDDSDNFQELLELASNSNNTSIKAVCTSPYIKINGDWNQFYDSKGRSLKKNLNWCINKLNSFGQLKFDRQETIDPSTLQQLFFIRQKRQEFKPGRSQFEDESFRGFFSELSNSFSSQGWLDFSTLKLDDQIIAYVYGFKFNGTVFYWNVAFEPKYQEFSPGKTLIKFLLEDSFKKGYSKFDFMIGDEPYKSHWATDNRMCFAVTTYACKAYFYIGQIKDRTRNCLKQLRGKNKTVNKVWIKVSKYL